MIYKVFIVNILLLVCSFSFGKKDRTTIINGDTVWIYPYSTKSLAKAKFPRKKLKGTYYAFSRNNDNDLKYIVQFESDKAIEITANDTIPRTEFYEYFDVSRFGVKDGRKHGEWIAYEFFGKDKEIAAKGFFVNGKKEGFEYIFAGDFKDRYLEYKKFYRSDTMIYSIYLNRDSSFYHKDTSYVYNYDWNGNLIEKGKKYNQLKIGKWINYWTNHQKRFEGNYRHTEDENIWNRSTETGIWKSYHKNGKIKGIIEYDSPDFNVASIIAQYDSSGILLDTLSYSNGVGVIQDFYDNGRINYEVFTNNYFEGWDSANCYSRSGIIQMSQFVRDHMIVTREYDSGGSGKFTQEEVTKEDYHNYPFRVLVHNLEHNLDTIIILPGKGINLNGDTIFLSETTFHEANNLISKQWKDVVQYLDIEIVENFYIGEKNRLGKDIDNGSCILSYIKSKKDESFYLYEIRVLPEEHCVVFCKDGLPFDLNHPLLKDKMILKGLKIEAGQNDTGERIIKKITIN